MQNSLCACFTGHRPHRLAWGYDESDLRCKELKLELLRSVYDAANSGYQRFYCGMALGVDLYAAETVLAMKNVLPELSLHCVLPCRGQADAWPPASRQRHRNILALADSVTVLNEAYHDRCMQERNRYMVDRATLLIAVYDGVSLGGTRQAIEYARKKGIEIMRIPA